MAGRKGVLFDTSTWSPIDLLDFYRLVPPEQVVYASDYPYGQQPNSLLIALKTARFAGLLRRPGSRDARRERERARRRPRTSGADEPMGEDTLSSPMQLARIHQYLSMATPLLWMRQADTIGVLGLAINTCAERNGHGESVDRIQELLVAARDLWARSRRSRSEGEARRMRLTHRLIHMADIEAVTA